MKKSVCEHPCIRTSWVLALLFLAGCGNDLTEIVLVVDSEASLREQLTGVHVTVFGESGNAALDESIELDAEDAPEFPLTVGLTPAGATNASVTIVVDATGEAVASVRREARVTFVSGERRMLRLVLHPACMTETCASSETCGDAGACVPIAIAEKDLPKWTGKVPESPVCASGEVEVSCNDRDDDCDDRVDENDDPAHDPENCGECGNVCDTGWCVQGICTSMPWRAHAFGERHACSIFAESNNVYCLGVNDRGQLGRRGDEEGSSLYSRVPSFQAITVVAGRNHTCALMGDARVACWGAGEMGQLGNGERDDSNTPVVVQDITNVTSIAAGFEHTCALDANGVVMCWGSGELAQLNGTVTAPTPFPIHSLLYTRALAIAAGEKHTCALVESTSVECWGTNDERQLGESDPTKMRVQLGGVSGATAISTGRTHTCVLLGGGTVGCWGGNGVGQSGIDSDGLPITPSTVPGTNGIEHLATGRNHTCMEGNDAVSCFGSNEHGQLLTEGAGGFTPIPLETSERVIGTFAGFDRTCVWLDESGPMCSRDPAE